MGPSGSDKREEVLKEVVFLDGNAKWGGKVQVLRVSLAQPDGTTKTFINKRLCFNTGRYINLPRAGIEEVLAALVAASTAEREHHEALLEELNIQRGPSRFSNGPRENPRGGNHQRNRSSES